MSCLLEIKLHSSILPFYLNLANCFKHVHCQRCSDVVFSFIFSAMSAMENTGFSCQLQMTLWQELRLTASLFPEVRKESNCRPSASATLGYCKGDEQNLFWFALMCS